MLFAFRYFYFNISSALVTLTVFISVGMNLAFGLRYLDGLAAAMAAEKMTDKDIKKLRESVELSEFYIKKHDAEHQKELDTAFHALIYTASGSRMLSETLSELHKKAKLYRRISLGVSSRAEKSIEEHKEILKAIEARDPPAAEILTQKHAKHRRLQGVFLSYIGKLKSRSIGTYVEYKST